MLCPLANDDIQQISPLKLKFVIICAEGTCRKVLESVNKPGYLKIIV